MSTRHAKPNAPLSHMRYMSSPEFVESRAVSASAVAQRCALLISPAKRQLIWFVQGISVRDGGLKRLAGEILKAFPERLGTPEMHRIGTDPAKMVNWEIVRGVNLSLGVFDRSDAWDDDKPRRPVPMKNLLALCSKVAISGCEEERRSSFDSRALSLAEFLIDLCINPRLQIRVDGQSGAHAAADEVDAEKAMEEYPELRRHDFKDASVPYFRDIIGALIEYKRSYEERARKGFYLTAIGRQIWNQLDDALRTRSMVVLEGLEGRGKTEAVKAWCSCHLGCARFVSLKGTSTKTTQFRAIAGALGIGHGPNKKVSEMQAAVEDVLESSKLMLVIDEAHYFFNQGSRMYTRPEMLDWIDTALCNPPLPVALITTPQFMVCMERAASQVGWNYRQFKRRCKRYWQLAAKNSSEDLAAVARHLLPHVGQSGIKLVLGYEALSKRDISAIGDVVREAALLAEKEGARMVEFDHVARAIDEVLFVSDRPWAEMEKRIRPATSKRRSPIHIEADEAETSRRPAEMSVDERGSNAGTRLNFDRFEAPERGRAAVRQSLPELVSA